MTKENSVFQIIEGLTLAGLAIITLLYVVVPALNFFSVFTFSGDPTTGVFVILLTISGVLTIFYMILNQFSRG